MKRYILIDPKSGSASNVDELNHAEMQALMAKEIMCVDSQMGLYWEHDGREWKEVKVKRRDPAWQSLDDAWTRFGNNRRDA